MRSILIIAGASGAGKTTVASRLTKISESFGMVRSITTRAPRGDGHDSEYIYTDRADFLKKVSYGELVEYMEYGDNLYGTPKSELERIFSLGKIPLLILDLEGVKSIRAGQFDFKPIIIYIWGSLNEIEKRLYKRDLCEPSAEKLLSFIKRKEMNIRDYLAMPQLYNLFDAFLENDGIDNCAKSIEQLFLSLSGGLAISEEENKRTAVMLSEMAKEKTI